MRRLGIALVLAAGLLFRAGGSGGAQALPLEVTLALDRTALEPGSPIAFTISVRNTTRVAVMVTYATSQRFDVILRAGGVEVDRWSRSRTFAEVVATQQFLPDEVVTFRDAWLPRDPLQPAPLTGTGAPPARGLYTATATLTTSTGLPPVSEPQAVIIGTPTPLPAGCTTLAAPFPVDLPIPAVTAAIEPPGALHGLWQAQLFDQYAGFRPGMAFLSDMRRVLGNRPLIVCLNAPGRIFLPG